MIKYMLLCLFTTTLSAAIPPGQWQCTAYDESEQSFQGLGMNMQQAMQTAALRCQQHSQRRPTCKTAQSFCEQGPLAVNEERCLVSDESGHTWNTDGVDACKTGLSICNQWQFLHGNIRSTCSVKHQYAD